jgi:hypothetical protein
MTGSDQGRRRGGNEAAARAERLAAELRANLKKRKDQARARAARASGPKPADDTGET